MLVLSRKLGEKLVIGVNGEIEVTLVDIERGRVRLGVTAPKELPIVRGELLDARPAAAGRPVPVPVKT